MATGRAVAAACAGHACGFVNGFGIIKIPFHRRTQWNFYSTCRMQTRCCPCPLL
jgi:hypothetical protein